MAAIVADLGSGVARFGWSGDGQPKALISGFEHEVGCPAPGASYLRLMPANATFFTRTLRLSFVAAVVGGGSYCCLLYG
jgi:hypothetical protein